MTAVAHRFTYPRCRSQLRPYENSLLFVCCLVQRVSRNWYIARWTTRRDRDRWRRSSCCGFEYLCHCSIIRCLHRELMRPRSGRNEGIFRRRKAKPVCIRFMEDWLWRRVGGLAYGREPKVSEIDYYLSFLIIGNFNRVEGNWRIF